MAIYMVSGEMDIPELGGRGFLSGELIEAKTRADLMRKIWKRGFLNNSRLDIKLMSAPGK